MQVLLENMEGTVCVWGGEGVGYTLEISQCQGSSLQFKGV